MRTGKERVRMPGGTWLWAAIVLLAIPAVLFQACGTASINEDEKFQKLTANYIEWLLQTNPEWATDLGDHRFDSLMGDNSLEAYAEQKIVQTAYLDSLRALEVSHLSPVNQVDHEILTHSIKSSLFRLDTIKTYEWNPMSYNPGGAIYQLVARDFAPLEERLKSVKGRLAAIPGMLENGKKNLKNPPQIHTETAILQIKGTIGFIGGELNGYLEQAPELAEEVKPLQEAAVTALEDFAAWLESDLLPRSTGDFRLGDDIYRRKLAYSTQAALTKEEILAHAEADLAATREELYQTARRLFAQYYPEVKDTAVFADTSKTIKMILDKQAEDHPTADNIVEKATACLKECEDFIRQKDLVTLPTEPLKIIVMPEFERGVAVAYCSSPGALEKKGETFYAISPPPKDWDAERVESYLREYNNQMLYNLTVHEAMPGHYLQAMHGNKFKAPTMVRALMGSGTFAEGWAVYTEKTMSDEGFGGDALKMQVLKMRLRMLINAIIDQKIHAAGMSEEEALGMMLNIGFQEPGEAAGKWRRACMSSAQLSTYYVGFLEMCRIREDYQKQAGAGFSLREYHDKLLSFGSPPPRLLRKLMGLS